MKKALVFVLILGFIGTLAFAQSSGKLTWNGYVDFGALLSNQSSTTTLTTYGADAWAPGRIRVTGTYTADNYGLSFRFQQDGTAAGTFTAAAPDLNQVWGWVKLANGMVQINAGELADYTWSTNQYSSFGNFDGATGIQVQIMPTKGANFGVFVPTNTTTFTSGSNTPAPLAFGGSYTSDMFYAAAGYNLQDSTGWLGLNYTGMKNLTAYVESQDVFSKTTANNYYYFDEYVAYDLGSATVGAYAEQQIPASSATNFVFNVSPVISYTMNNVTLGLRGNYASDSVNSGYGVGAYAKLAVSSNAWVQLGAAYDGGKAAPTNAASVTTQGNLFYQNLYGPLTNATTSAVENLPTQSNGLMRAYLGVGTSF